MAAAPLPFKLEQLVNFIVFQHFAACVEFLRYQISIDGLSDRLCHVSSAGKLILKLCPFRFVLSILHCQERVKLHNLQRFKLALVSRNIICWTTFTCGSSIKFTIFHLNREGFCITSYDEWLWFYCRVFISFRVARKIREVECAMHELKSRKIICILQLFELASSFHF